MRHFIALVIGLFFTFVAMSANAETINLLQTQDKVSLYEQPDAKSKVIANLIKGETIIPLLQQKDWIKIANPKNGDVGWAEKATVEKNTKSFLNITSNDGSQYVITQKDKSGNTQNIYQVMQYSGTNPANQKQSEEVFKQIQAQQKAMQEQFNKMFSQPMFNNATIYRVPVMQPVIVIEKPTPAKIESTNSGDKTK